MDIESLAMVYCNRMKNLYPEMLAARYKLGEVSSFAEMGDYELLCLIGKKRGFLISGGEINTERTADMLIDELRAAKLGRYAPVQRANAASAEKYCADDDSRDGQHRQSKARPGRKR